MIHSDKIYGGKLLNILVNKYFFLRECSDPIFIVKMIHLTKYNGKKVLFLSNILVKILSYMVVILSGPGAKSSKCCGWQNKNVKVDLSNSNM